MRHRPTSLLIAFALAACAGPSGVGRSSSESSVRAQAPSDLPSTRLTVVTLARSLLGSRQVAVNGKHYPDDCSGFVRAVYEHAGVNLMSDARAGDSGTHAIFRYAQRHGHVYQHGHPQPGDLVFFHDTYDKNRIGRSGSGLTHVGVVDAADSDGTVHIIHRVRRGVVRYRMNLIRPHLHWDPASRQTLNDYLRIEGKQTHPVLTGELFAAYGSVLSSELKTASR